MTEETLIEISRLQREAEALPQMTVFEATMIAEGNWELAGYEPDEDTQIEAWQLLIDTGVCWQLQGAFGRRAAALIEAGVCQPAARAA